MEARLYYSNREIWGPAGRAYHIISACSEMHGDA